MKNKEERKGKKRERQVCGLRNRSEFAKFCTCLTPVRHHIVDETVLIALVDLPLDCLLQTLMITPFAA